MNEVSAIALDRPATTVETEELTPAALAIGVIVAALALAGFLAILATGHLDEDAYILFTYSSNLAAGHGIVWDWAHGHAEGATDFLWMVLLAGLDRLGMDVGAAAGLLNAAGLAMSYFAVSRIARLRGALTHGLLAVALLVSHVTAGSLGGFSADFYCGVFALSCYFAVRRQYAALALALLTLGFCAGRDRTGWLLLALVPSLAFGARAIDREVLHLVQPDYVNYLPQMLDPLLGKDGRVAMTEAGRFGFRLHADKLDIVGLNSKAIAVRGNRVQALEAFKPDLVFLHQVRLGRS